MASLEQKFVGRAKRFATHDIVKVRQTIKGFSGVVGEPRHRAASPQSKNSPA